MEYITAAHSDAGISGKGNQDSFCLYTANTVRGSTVLAVLCDGMGGLQKGELASAAAVYAFANWFLNCLPDLLIRDAVLEAVQGQWRALLEQVNLQLLEHARRTGLSIGTTVTAMLLLGSQRLICNLGDSRAYIHDGSALCQLTQDHSLVGREVALGRLSEDEARVHPQCNVLLQCLGAAAHIAPDFFEGRSQANSIYLLCSDGFTHVFPRDELSARLDPLRLPDQQSMAGTLAGLTEDMKARGETDNITAMLIRARESAVQSSAKQGALAGLRNKLSRRAAVPEPPQPLFQVTESILSVHTQERLGPV